MQSLFGLIVVLLFGSGNGILAAPLPAVPHRIMCSGVVPLELKNKVSNSNRIFILMKPLKENSSIVAGIISAGVSYYNELPWIAQGRFTQHYLNPLKESLVVYPTAESVRWNRESNYGKLNTHFKSLKLQVMGVGEKERVMGFLWLTTINEAQFGIRLECSVMAAGPV